MTATLRARPVAPSKRQRDEQAATYAAAVASPVLAWEIMLVLGTFHGAYHQVPALSYWWTLLAVALLRSLLRVSYK